MGRRVALITTLCSRNVETAPVTKRTFVTFQAAFPDESQWTSRGSPLVPDGRSISMVLAEGLSRAGLRSSHVVQHKFYGWAFEVEFPNCVVWCLLQGGDPWLLLMEKRRRGWRRLSREDSAHDLDVVLKAIDRTLKRDGRFSSIVWLTKQQYESRCPKGADTPV